MRSMFTSAPFSRFDLGRHILGQALGQMQDPYLTQAERDKLLADIRSAVAQTKAIDDLLVWSGENEAGFRKFLGPDATRFFALTNSIAPLYPTVRDLSERLSETDAEFWYRPSDQELAQVKQWVTGVNEMTKLIERRRTQPYTAAPGEKPPPISVTQPMQPLPTRVEGISTQDVLVGGAVALGLGILLSAIL